MLACAVLLVKYHASMKVFRISGRDITVQTIITLTVVVASMKVFRISGRDGGVFVGGESFTDVASMKVFRISGRDCEHAHAHHHQHDGLNESLPHKRKRPGS